MDQFHFSARRKDQRNPYCKPCIKVAARAYSDRRNAPKRAAREAAALKVFDPATGLRECTGCKVSKALEEFPPRKRALMGRCRRCRACESSWEKQHKAAKFKADPLLHRRKALERSYGMTLEAFDALVTAQGGGCAVCGATKSSNRIWRLQVDHDHVTGKLRGILCNRCNTALGMVNDDCSLLEKLIAYVKSHAAKP